MDKNTTQKEIRLDFGGGNESPAAARFEKGMALEKWSVCRLDCCRWHGTLTSSGLLDSFTNSHQQKRISIISQKTCEKKWCMVNQEHFVLSVVPIQALTTGMVLVSMP
jgi:hypothetical protein